MTKGQRIKLARERAGMSQTELALAISTSKQNMYKYENDIITNIPSDKIEAMSIHLGVPPEYLMCWTDDAIENTVTAKFPAPNITEDYTTFPVIGEIAAGYDHIAVEDWDGDLVDVPNSYLCGRSREDFFVLKVKGGSMWPDYRDGDKVLILKQSTLDYSGQVGAVIYDDNIGTLKKVEFVPGEDWMKLVPINPVVDEIEITGERLEHCRVLGIPKLLIRNIQN